MKSFIVRLFNCCHPNREYDDIDQLIKSRNDDNKLEKPPETSYLTSIQIDTEESSIISTKMETSIVKESQLGNSNKGFFNDRLIREEERQHITFTRKGLISFVTDISNLDGYDLIYNKNRFVLFTRMSGSVMNPNLCISKSLYTLPKSELNKSVDIPFLINLMFSPLNRLSWDVSLKFYEKLEGDEDTSVIRTVMHSPMIMISEREFVDKRAEFIDGGVYYNISTSVPEDFIPNDENVVRVKTYFNVSLIHEDKENFIFTSITQIDLKINVPQKLINSALPGKWLSWYGNYLKAINK